MYSGKTVFNIKNDINTQHNAHFICFIDVWLLYLQ